MWKRGWLVLLPLLVVGCRPQSRPPSAQPPSTERPTTPSGGTEAATEGKIAWLASLDEGLKQAQTSRRPVLIDFFATWCGPCKMMDEKTWPDPAVAAVAAGFVTVRLDVDEHPREADRYKIGSIPAVVIVDAAGKEVGRSVGYVDAGKLVDFLKQHGGKS